MLSRKGKKTVETDVKIFLIEGMVLEMKLAAALSTRMFRYVGKCSKTTSVHVYNGGVISSLFSKNIHLAELLEKSQKLTPNN